MTADRQMQIAQLEDIMEWPEKYVPLDCQESTPEIMRVISREALFLKLDLERMA